MVMGTRQQLYHIMGFTVTAALAVACAPQPAQMPGAQAVPVRLQQIQPGSFQDSSEFVGTLEAQRRVDLKPEIDGRITQIFAAPGDPVTVGQPIMQLNPDQVQAQLSGAQAGVSAALATRDAAGARLDAAQAERSQVASDVKLAEAEFERTQSLVEKGALSTQELDQVRNQLEVATARQQQVEKNISAAQSQLEQATANLSQAQAQVNVNREDVGFKQLKAPIAGIMGDLSVKVGDFVERGDNLTSITQNDFLFLRIQVPTSRSNQLKIGLPVELIDPNTNFRIEAGSISFIAPEVNANSQTILVKARFPNDGDKLREGQFVRARVVWTTTSELLVPTVAVTRIGAQSFVFVADEAPLEDGQIAQVVVQRPVQLGDIQGDSYRIVDGLESGESIAVTNILKLQDGVPIQADEQSSNPLPGS